MLIIFSHIYPAVLLFYFLYRHIYISKHPLYEESDREDWVEYMSDRLRSSGKAKGRILDVEIVERRSIYYYQEKNEPFMKVTLQFPGDVVLCREILRVVFDHWDDD